MSVASEASSEGQRPPAAVEKPSGKGAKDENFPVGSFLLPKRLRPHVATFYAFARAIDDIADDEELSPEEKINRLQGMDRALNGDSQFVEGYEKAIALRQSLVETGVSTVHGSDLIAAFIQDCRKLRYQSWSELIDYCSLSANPVGRYLLDLHGEERSAYRYSDALCTVLQITNHLQDCGEDRARLDRVYIIEPWIIEEGGAIDELDQNQSSPALDRVKNRMLDGCAKLAVDMRKLPAALNSKHLAMESAVIVRLADRLIEILRAGDPLAARVALTKFDFVKAGATGAIAGFFAAGRGVS